MGKVVRYEACPVCRSQGRDSRGDNLVRYDDDSAWCFACHHREPASVKTILGKLLEEKRNGTASKILPASFTREIPARAFEWLFRYGLGYNYWQGKIGFAPEEDRLVFRVGEPLAFSIGRHIPKEPSPRLVAAAREGILLADGRRIGGVVPTGNGKPPRKWYAYGEPHKHCEVLHPDSGPGKNVVLVEDIVSAHKVGRRTSAIPLFGTQIHPPVMYYLMNQDKPIVIWLDKDQEHAVHKTAMQLQSMVDVPVSVIITDEDPKCQSFETIKELTK